MIPTPPNPAKADAILDDLRADLADARRYTGAGRIGALARAAVLFERLDSHLSMGGTPPTAWTEGPDEPLVDDQSESHPFSSPAAMKRAGLFTDQADS